MRPRRERVGELSELRGQVAVQTIEPVRRTEPVGGPPTIPARLVSLGRTYGSPCLPHVQQLLGHASVQTTALYTRVVTGELAQVVSEERPRERLWNERGKRAQAVAKGKRVK